MSANSEPLRVWLVPVCILAFMGARFLFASIGTERLSFTTPKTLSDKLLVDSHNETEGCHDEVKALQDQLSSTLHTIEDLQNSADTTEPLKTTSPACRPRFLSHGHKIRRIFFLHMRKAGGTTIRFYLKKVAQVYNLTFVAAEGSKTVEAPMDNNTLYVTNLREPVARAISHYKYDHRWDCNQLIHNKSFVPSINNTRGSLEDFIDQAHEKYSYQLWNCSSNCYTRWATGIYHEGNSCSIGETDERVKLARELLFRYNVIINTERLRDEDYIRGIEEMFGVTGLVGRRAFCVPESAAANKKIPLVISNSTRKKLEDCNAADTILYKQLVTCAENDIEFPKFNQSYFV